MIATDKFVFVHFPKTGGTFVTDVLYELGDLVHAEEVFAKGTIWSYFRKVRMKHGTCRQIPPEHRHRRIVSTIRHPLDWYVSKYEFGWWKREQYNRLYHRIPDFRRRYPKFPELSFEQFMNLQFEAYRDYIPQPKAGTDQIGLYSRQFLRFFFHDLNSAASRLDYDYLLSGQFREDMYDVRLLKQASLNTELHGFLEELGYPAGQLSFILERDRVFPLNKGRSDGRTWREYYSCSLEETVRRREWMMFSMFPELDED